MVQDLAGTLKIVAVVVLSALAIATIAGFYEGRNAARRAFVWVLGLGSVVGLLQIVQVRHAPWVLVYGAGLGAFAWWRRRRR